MTSGKWCDKIIKSNKDTWQHFFDQFLPAFVKNLKFVSFSDVVFIAEGDRDS